MQFKTPAGTRQVFSFAASIMFSFMRRIVRSKEHPTANRTETSSAGFVLECFQSNDECWPVLFFEGVEYKIVTIDFFGLAVFAVYYLSGSDRSKKPVFLVGFQNFDFE